MISSFFKAPFYGSVFKDSFEDFLRTPFYNSFDFFKLLGYFWLDGEFNAFFEIF